ncbi:unnamed protein product, partial [Mesorhabditis belari]
TRRSYWNFTNLRVCQAERFSTEKWAPCPSLRPHDPIDWPCIRAVELCNGNRDCPNGEDEEPNMCMFHSLNQGSLRQLQRDFLRFSGATPHIRNSTNDKEKLLNFTNLRVCRAERFSTEKWAPCASLRIGPIRQIRPGLRLDSIDDRPVPLHFGNRCMAFTIHRTGSGQTIDRIPFIEHRDDNYTVDILTTDRVLLCRQGLSSKHLVTTFYIQKDRDSMIKQQQQQNKLENAAKHYADRVRELEDILAKNGLNAPTKVLPTFPAIPSAPRPIKQEIEESRNQTPWDHFPHRLKSTRLSDATMEPDSQRMHHGPFPDLITEWCLENNPLLHSDPLMSQAGGPSSNLAVSQMSHGLSWDPTNFSPDPNTVFHPMLLSLRQRQIQMRSLIWISKKVTTFSDSIQHNLYESQSQEQNQDCFNGIKEADGHNKMLGLTRPELKRVPSAARFARSRHHQNLAHLASVPDQKAEIS